MSVAAGTIEFVDHFCRAQALSTTPGMNGWTVKDTSPSGTPTYLCVTEDGGAMALTLAATSEAEIVTMYQNDVLPLDLAQLQRIGFIVKVAGVDSATQIAFGVASAQNDTLDSVAVNAWFRIDGSADTGKVVIETDDGVTDNDDNVTGQTLGSAYKKCEIDFGKGLGDIRFFIDGQPVGAETFSLLGITAGQNVQPFVQVQKASGTGVAAITIAQVFWQTRYSYGS
ncbi:MAG TPA: hypothetical protein DDY91_24005 [Planctomycetaceae bacterium]|jgi:hypothetical protein|nr:hypothetical protein [Planctomycetaceae bacterium]